MRKDTKLEKVNTELERTSDDCTHRSRHSGCRTEALQPTQDVDCDLVWIVGVTGHKVLSWEAVLTLGKSTSQTKDSHPCASRYERQLAPEQICESP